MFFNLKSWASHDISYAVDNTLILFLEFISLEVGHSVWVIIVGMGDGVSLGFDSGFSMSEIGIMSGFVLEIEELLCFFDIH